MAAAAAGVAPDAGRRNGLPATAGQSLLTPGQDPREEASLTGGTCRRQARVVRLQERRWNIRREQHKQHAMSDNTCSHVAFAGSSSRTLTTAQTEFIADLEERLRRLEENINLVESPGSFAGRSSSSRQQAEGAEDEQLDEESSRSTSVWSASEVSASPVHESDDEEAEAGTKEARRSCKPTHGLKRNVQAIRGGSPAHCASSSSRSPRSRSRTPRRMPSPAAASEGGEEEVLTEDELVLRGRRCPTGGSDAGMGPRLASPTVICRRCNWRHWHVCQPPLPCWQPTPRWRQPDSCCRPASGGRSGEGCQAAHMAMHRTDDREAEAEGGNVGAGRG